MEQNKSSEAQNQLNSPTAQTSPENPPIKKKSRITAKAIIMTIAIYILITGIIASFIYRNNLRSIFSNPFSIGKEISASLRESEDGTTANTSLSSSDRDGRFLSLTTDSDYSPATEFRSAAGGFSVPIKTGFYYHQTPGDLVEDIDSLVVYKSDTLENYKIVVKKNAKPSGGGKYDSAEEYFKDYDKTHFASPTIKTDTLEKITVDGNTAYKVTLGPYNNALVVTFKNDFVYEFFGSLLGDIQKFLSDFEFKKVQSDPTLYWHEVKLENLTFKTPIGWLMREISIDTDHPALFNNEQHFAFILHKNLSIDASIEASSVPINSDAIMVERTVDEKPAREYTVSGNAENGIPYLTKRIFIQADSDTYEVSASSTLSFPPNPLPIVFNQILSTFKLDE